MDARERREWKRYVLGLPDGKRPECMTWAWKGVLLALETFADYPAGTNAHPGEEKLAEVCGLTTRTVRDALKRGRDLKLIEQTARENPKRGRAAVYRLISTGITVPVENPSGKGSLGVSTGTGVPLEDGFYRNNGTFLPERGGVSTGTGVPPTKPYTPDPLNTRSVGTGERKSGTSPHPDLCPPPAPDFTPDMPEPPKTCSAHPYGTRESCIPCKLWRQYRDAWFAWQVAYDEALNAEDQP
ncbi:hypothetical protein [Mycobacterium sp. 852002-30065_SCH5024008]|uniref:hypothetical protein n=1 Tax=Mycobacterium sp. 852002-30065_SCH5024008 TaxID=1834088 RepID=UPI000AD4C9D2|nr:hypothetical protein [Mycobacterium sp. 852002-30065_SCH5024008]